jgi:hypothetical protein
MGTIVDVRIIYMNQLIIPSRMKLREELTGRPNFLIHSTDGLVTFVYNIHTFIGRRNR